MKAVLLAGGLGTRMREETEFRPKPMVEVGGKPVLWHIMKVLSAQGIKDFIVCTGYKSEVIKNYFLNYKGASQDFTVTLGDAAKTVFHGSHDEFDWTVTVVDTGPTTMTGERIKKIEKYVKGERFLATYGDGIADINISDLLEFHDNHGRAATITTTRPSSRFGLVDADENGLVQAFREKPKVNDWINIGYFVFEPKIFDHLHTGSVLEEGPLRELTLAKQIGAFKHDGFWQPMDTFRESQLLNEIWDSGSAAWKVW